MYYSTHPCKQKKRNIQADSIFGCFFVLHPFRNFSPFCACAGAGCWLKLVSGVDKGGMARARRGVTAFHPRKMRGTGRGTVGRIAQLVEQRTEKSLLTHFTPFLPVAWTITKPLILKAKTIFCPFSARSEKVSRTDGQLAQQLAQTGKVLSPLVCRSEIRSLTLVKE